jgi:hypothetical protein
MKHSFVQVPDGVTVGVVVTEGVGVDVGANNEHTVVDE